jgi:hypothetical protein
MTGFEVIVRPVVFPNIRPQAPRVLAPASDPTQGIATIGGSGGRVIDLPHSWQVSSSHTVAQTETERTYDVDRIYKKDDGGVIDEDSGSYVDVERIKKAIMKDPDGSATTYHYADPPTADNVKTLQTNLVRKSDGQSP